MDAKEKVQNDTVIADNKELQKETGNPAVGPMPPDQAGTVSGRPKREEKKVSVWPFILRLKEYMKKYWVKYVLSLVAIVVGAELGLLPSILTGRIVDEALMSQDLALLLELALMSLVAVIAEKVVYMINSYLNSWVTEHVLFDIKNDMYGHLQQMSDRFYKTENQGDIITRMNSDIQGVAMVLSQASDKLFSSLATVVTTVVALFRMNWKLALIGMAIIPFMMIPVRKEGKVGRKILSEKQEKTDELNQIIHNTLSVKGSFLAKVFNREAEEYELFERANQEATELELREDRVGLLFRSMNNVIIKIGPLLVYLAGCYMMIQSPEEEVTVGKITAMVAMLNRLYFPVSSVLNVSVSLNRSVALLSRVFDYLDRNVEIKSPDHPLSPSMENASVAFDHVNFGYREGEQCLYDVSLKVDPGQIVAVVGGSGCGKSSLAKLVIRLYDVWNGSVSVADTDVRKFDLKYLRDRIGLVTQELYVLSGTVRYNLLFARKDATQEELDEVCKATGFDEVVARLPQGYETPVGKGGRSLSEDEQQQLAIARVLLKHPDILILDEATSEFDTAEESSVHDDLIRYMNGKPVIIMAQRLATAMKADKIYVMKEGRIVQEGTHSQLIGQEGEYKALYQAQYGEKAEA